MRITKPRTIHESPNRSVSASLERASNNNSAPHIDSQLEAPKTEKQMIGRLKNEKYLIDQQIQKIKDLKQMKTQNQNTSSNNSPRRKGLKQSKRGNVEINIEIQNKSPAQDKKKRKRAKEYIELEGIAASYDMNLIKSIT